MSVGSSGPHAQFETQRFLAYIGVWWSRWAFGVIGGVDEERCATLALCFGPFYIGVGVCG